MAFVFNTGTTVASPMLPAADRYLQLSHPAAPDSLILQWMPDSGSYKPPRKSGLLQVTGRTATASLTVLKASMTKKEWQDMAYVVTLDQLRLLEALANAQTGSTPCTLIDNTLLEYSSYLVMLQVGGDYASPYSGLKEFLVQFSMSEV